VQRSNYYSFVFISIITVVCAGLLSVTSMALKPRQELNEIVEMKKNILKAVGIIDNQTKMSQDEILSVFNRSIESRIVNRNGESVILPDGISIDNIDPELEEQKNPDQQYLPVYIQKINGEIASCCVPIFGKGLWSTIYGYLALENDLKTIKGVTFYKHGETPGLGAEIVADWFTENFKGKKIFDKEGKLTSVKILKGKALESSPDFAHKVDGISGATKTCDGVNIFLLKDLQKYERFFINNRSSN